VGLTKNLASLVRKNLIYRATASALLIGLFFIFGGRAVFNILGIP
jgi:small neutral amino acid transporter SnatA (MarC family)